MKLLTAATNISFAAMIMIPSPSQLGFPSKYKDWRPRQKEAIEEMLGVDKRFISRLMRPGAGKTGVEVAYSKLSDSPRTLILTYTKGLQEQLLRDFEGMGLREIKGKGNYNCACLPGKTCEDGQIGKCQFKGSTMCAWSGARDEAVNAPLVTANYALWISSNKYGTGFGDFDLLICDECQHMSECLNKAMQVQISEHECQMLKFSWPDSDMRADMVMWKNWGIVARSRADTQLQALEEKLKKTAHPTTANINEFKNLKNLHRKLTDLGSCNPAKWTVESSTWGYQFDPINSAEYAEKYLFAGIPKVLALSGTNRPKTLEMLGVGPDEYDYREYSGDIDPERSPLIRIPTAKVWRESEEWQLQRIVQRVDEIIEIWGMYRGIVQTANFKLRDYIKSNSQYGRYMITNYAQNGDVTADVVRRFKATDPPVILITPSVHTGYDFNGAAARWNVIAKVQFPDDRSAVEQARKAEDPERGAHFAIQYLEQAHGRTNRGDDDWSVTMVIDDNCSWLVRKYGHLASADFHLCYRESDYVPFPASMDGVSGNGKH